MSSQCGFSGNPDLYGLGIRMGVYLQWVTAGTAYGMDLRHEASNVFEAYIMFAIAIMIALFTVTFTSQMHVIEIAVMLYLYFGGLMSVVYYIANQYPTDRRLWRQFAVVISWFVTGGYSAWFWLHGRKTDHFVEDPCGTTLFLFAKLGPSHLSALSKFFASISIFFGLCFGLMAIPLPPNFTAEQGRAYLDLEKEAVLHDLAEFKTDFKLPVAGMSVMKRKIDGWYENRESYFVEVQQAFPDMFDETKNKETRQKQSSKAMKGARQWLLAILEQIPGLDTLRRLCSLSLHYYGEWKEWKECRETDKPILRQKLKHMPALSLLELNELCLRDEYRKEDKEGKEGEKGEKGETGGEDKNRRDHKERRRRIPFTAIHAIISAYTIIAIELMLHWNKVKDVYTIQSVGQLIPFVIGLVGFLKLFVELRYQNKVDGDDYFPHRKDFWKQRYLAKYIRDWLESAESEKLEPSDGRSLRMIKSAPVYKVKTKDGNQ